MTDFGSNDFQLPKQQRSLKTLQDIIEATGSLIQSEGLDVATAENISAKSGYSIGGIFHHFKKIDYIFLHLFMIKRKHNIAEIGEIIRSHNPQHDITRLITTIVDFCVSEIGAYRIKTLQFMVRVYFKHTKNPENFDAIFDVLLDDLAQAIKKDQTNTFATLDAEELKLNLRAFQMILRSPVYEGSPMAGSEKHRSISINIGIKLFGR